MPVHDGNKITSVFKDGQDQNYFLGQTTKTCASSIPSSSLCPSYVLEITGLALRLEDFG